MGNNNNKTLAEEKIDGITSIDQIHEEINRFNQLAKYSPIITPLDIYTQ
jgi:hypothetical protein